jgi:hypothetical protein
VKQLKAAAVVIGSLVVAGAAAPAFADTNSPLPLDSIGSVTDSVSGLTGVAKNLPVTGATATALGTVTNLAGAPTSALGTLQTNGLSTLGELPLGH